MKNPKQNLAPQAGQVPPSPGPGFQPGMYQPATMTPQAPPGPGALPPPPAAGMTPTMSTGYPASAGPTAMPGVMAAPVSPNAGASPPPALQALLQRWQGGPPPTLNPAQALFDHQHQANVAQGQGAPPAISNIMQMLLQRRQQMQGGMGAPPMPGRPGPAMSPLFQRFGWGR